MNIVKGKIKYLEYESDLLLKDRLNLLNESEKTAHDISISNLGLSYFSAKAALSSENHTSGKLLTLARSMFGYYPFVIENINGFWSISEGGINLRDNSKTSKIGDIAQGINYYISFHELGVASVWDFRNYVYSHYKVLVGNRIKTPDYVVVYKDNTIGLLESKGSLDKNPTSLIRKGSLQVDSGKNILSQTPLKNSYIAAVSFASSVDSPDRKTSAYFIDPSYAQQIKEKNEDYKPGLLYECSKHLRLAGNERLADRFLYAYTEGDQQVIKKHINELDVTGSFIVGSYTYEMGFSDRLINALYSGRDDLDDIKFESYIDANTEYFMDGTYIRVIQNSWNRNYYINFEFERG